MTIADLKESLVNISRSLLIHTCDCRSILICFMIMAETMDCIQQAAIALSKSSKSIHRHTATRLCHLQQWLGG